MPDQIIQFYSKKAICLKNVSMNGTVKLLGLNRMTERYS